MHTVILIYLTCQHRYSAINISCISEYILRSLTFHPMYSGINIPCISSDVFWYREQNEVEELEDGEDVEFSVDGERHSATLYNIDRAHAGQYMCIALNDKGKAIKYLTVTVKGKTSSFTLFVQCFKGKAIK